MENSLDPGQTGLAVWSGFTLFAKTCLSEYNVFCIPIFCKLSEISIFLLWKQTDYTRACAPPASTII